MARARKLVLTIKFDPKKIGETELTDSLNEHLRGIAVESDWHSDEKTGGYVELDWWYA